MTRSRLRAIMTWLVIIVNILVGAALADDITTIERIKHRQRCLTLLNFPVGKIDGVVGPNTVVAYRNFARTHFGPHWETVPVDTRNGFLEMLCALTAAAYEQDAGVLLDRLKKQDF